MDLSPFDPVIQAAQRMSGDVGVVFYEEMNMLVFFIDADVNTEDGLVVVHKILLTDPSNFKEDMVAYHVPLIKKGIDRLKYMRARHRDDYDKLGGGVSLNTKAGHKF